MTDVMTATKSISMNMIATHGRSLFGLACGLFSTRRGRNVVEFDLIHKCEMNMKPSQTRLWCAARRGNDGEAVLRRSHDPMFSILCTGVCPARNPSFSDSRKYGRD